MQKESQDQQLIQQSKYSRLPRLPGLCGPPAPITGRSALPSPLKHWFRPAPSSGAKPIGNTERMGWPCRSRALWFGDHRWRQRRFSPAILSLRLILPSPLFGSLASVLVQQPVIPYCCPFTLTLNLAFVSLTLLSLTLGPTQL